MADSKFAQRLRKVDLLTQAVDSPLNGHKWKSFGKGILCINCQHCLKPPHAIAASESGFSLTCTGLQGKGDQAESRVHFTHTLTCVQPGNKVCCHCNGAKIVRGQVSQKLARPCRPRKVLCGAIPCFVCQKENPPPRLVAVRRAYAGQHHVHALQCRAERRARRAPGEPQGLKCEGKKELGGSLVWTLSWPAFNRKNAKHFQIPSVEPVTGLQDTCWPSHPFQARQRVSARNS